ncbi:hypothetical protein L1887_21422 [Cichorium endivia]|nr:hypothetical protein L1887_21422 [Cichorium endivia]
MVNLNHRERLLLQITIAIASSNHKQRLRFLLQIGSIAAIALYSYSKSQVDSRSVHSITSQLADSKKSIITQLQPLLSSSPSMHCVPPFTIFSNNQQWTQTNRRNPAGMATGILAGLMPGRFLNIKHQLLIKSAVLKKSSPHGDDDESEGGDQLVRRRRRLDLKGDDLAETSAVRRRQSWILSRWAARQAQEMITTIERRNLESELMALTSASAINKNKSNDMEMERRSQAVPSNTPSSCKS